MQLKKNQRDLLTRAAKGSGQWLAVTQPKMSISHSYRIRRAAYRLQEMGLIEIRKGIERWSERKSRLQFRLTAFGDEFCDVFGTELLKCSRIKASKYERIVGTPMPHRTTRINFPWLTHNRHRGSNPNHASAPASA